MATNCRQDCKCHFIDDYKTKRVKYYIKCCNDKNNKCSKIISISSVPFIITRPGKYCVTNNLTFNGTGPAIIIRANNVIDRF